MHLVFSLQPLSYLLLLFLKPFQPLFVDTFCPLCAEPRVRKVQACCDIGPLNQHFEWWHVQTSPVLDWDPKQWLAILTHHPSIPHALQHKFISMSGMPVLGCEICDFPDSYTRVPVIGCQHCSISYKCHACVCFTQNLSAQMAGVGVEEPYYVLVFEPKSNESLAKGMVSQSR